MLKTQHSALLGIINSKSLSSSLNKPTDGRNEMSKMLPYVVDGMEENQDHIEDYDKLVEVFNTTAREIDATPYDVLLAAYHVYALRHNINAMVENKNMHIRPSELRKRKQKFKFVD